MNEPSDVPTDLPDLAEVPLDQVDAALDGGQGAVETLRRVAPDDGTRLLVAASFNSAI